MEKMKKQIIEDAANQAEKKINENEQFVPEEKKRRSKKPLITIMLILFVLSFTIMGIRIYSLNSIPEMSEEEMLISVNAVMYFSALSVESFKDINKRLPITDEIEIDNEYVSYKTNNEYYIISVKTDNTMLIYNSQTDKFPELPEELGGGK